MYTTEAVQWNIHVQCSRHIYSWVYANNVRCMYTSANLQMYHMWHFRDIFVAGKHMAIVRRKKLHFALR